MQAERPQPERPFAQPWHAAAFALVVHLHDRGVFTWSEWSGALGAALRAPNDAATTQTGDGYYTAWLAALQSLLQERGIAGKAEVEGALQAWRHAHLHTPHGAPVRLGVDGTGHAAPARKA